jgi:hypothetical protein
MKEIVDIGTVTLGAGEAKAEPAKKPELNK